MVIPRTDEHEGESIVKAMYLAANTHLSGGELAGWKCYVNILVVNKIELFYVVILPLWMKKFIAS